MESLMRDSSLLFFSRQVFVVYDHKCNSMTDTSSSEEGYQGKRGWKGMRCSAFSGNNVLTQIRFSVAHVAVAARKKSRWERRCMLTGMRHRSPRRTTSRRCTLHIRRLSPRFTSLNATGRPVTLSAVPAKNRDDSSFLPPSVSFFPYLSSEELFLINLSYLLF